VAWAPEVAWCFVRACDSTPDFASISLTGTFHCAAAAARSLSRALAPACIKAFMTSPDAPAPAKVDQIPVAPR
jgi:hypothetical protein